MANEIMGKRHYAFVYDEATFNTKPGSPDYIPVPVNECKLVFKAENRKAQPQLGLFVPKHSSNPKGMVSGSFNMNLLGYKLTPPAVTLAQHFLDWAFGDETTVLLPSKGIQWAEGPNIANHEFGGCRVNDATLQGSSDSNVIELNMNLMGASDTYLTTAQTLPNSHQSLSDFEFGGDSTLSIDTVATPFSGFSIQQQNGLKPSYLNSRVIQKMPRSTCTRLLTFNVPKESAAYDNYERNVGTTADFAIVITLRGLHNGTGASGTFTTVSLTMPKCRFVTRADNSSPDTDTGVAVTCDVLKPDTSAKALTLAYGNS